MKSLSYGVKAKICYLIVLFGVLGLMWIDAVSQAKIKELEKKIAFMEDQRSGIPVDFQAPAPASATRPGVTGLGELPRELRGTP